MKLYFQEVGEGQPLIILHGLFGSGDNWLTHARQLASHFRVIVVDQRNHGRSAHHEEMSYAVMAEDLLELIAALDLRDVIVLGHSMGGKTAMHFAQQHPFLVDRLVVVDMGVREYPPHHDQIFEGLFAVRVNEISSRKEAETRLTPYTDDPATLQFLLKNLYWVETGRLAWRFNLNTLYHSVSSILERVPEETVCPVPALFMKGERSEYIRVEDREEIIRLFPAAVFQEVKGAGHWPHAEAPAEFVRILEEFLL